MEKQNRKKPSRRRQVSSETVLKSIDGSSSPSADSIGETFGHCMLPYICTVLSSTAMSKARLDFRKTLLATSRKLRQEAERNKVTEEK